MDRLESLCNGCEVYENEEYLEAVSVKEEPISEEEVSADIPLDCLLCAKKLHTMSGLKAHVLAQHNYKSVKRKCGDCPSPDKATKRPKHVCTTCGRSFVTSTDLKVHEVCHNKFCCFACNAKFNTFKAVSRHRRRCKSKKAEAVAKPKTLSDILNKRKTLKQSEKPEEEHKQLLVKCIKCADTFPDIESYKLHKVLQHSEKDALENLEKKIDIANLKQEPEDPDQKDTKPLDNALVGKDEKEKVDYAKIETELESIFDIAVEKRQMQVTILENETDNTIGDTEEKGVDKGDDQKKTIEDILKSPGLSQEIKIEPATTRDSEQEETNEPKAGSKTDSMTPTEISITDNEEKTNLSKEDLSVELETDSSSPKRDIDERNSEIGSSKEMAAETLNVKSPVDNTESTNDINVDVPNSGLNHNKKSELNHTIEIEPKIDHTKTIEEQDKENEKPEQNSDTELINDKSNDLNIKIVTIEHNAIGKTLNSEIKSSDIIDRDVKCDEIEQEALLKGAMNNGPIEELIEK